LLRRQPDCIGKPLNRTLLRENLKLTVEERFLNLVELQRFATDIRRASQHAKRLPISPPCSDYLPNTTSNSSP
jgi:hypothetical protein